MKSFAVLIGFIWIQYVIASTPCPYKICDCDVPGHPEYINCAYKQLTSVPPLETGKFTQTYLWLDYNNIKNINKDTELPADITRLSLPSNNLQHIDPAAFSRLTSLTHLDISNNQLTSISQLIFPSSLTYLYAYNNAITSVTALTFTNPSSNSLEYLYLSQNPISTISSDAFSHLSQLTRLYLHNTQLTHLPLSIKSLTNLEVLYLDSIPTLTCSCSQSALSAWYLHRKNNGGVGIRGSCVGGSSVVYFLETLAPQCPSRRSTQHQPRSTQ